MKKKTHDKKGSNIVELHKNRDTGTDNLIHLMSSNDETSYVSNAIEASINHFKTVRKNIKRVSNLIQEDNLDEINTGLLRFTPSKCSIDHEPLYVNKINYTAILSLELLGITSPSQQRIEIMEFLIWITIYTDKSIREVINLCLYKKEYEMNCVN